MKSRIIFDRLRARCIDWGRLLDHRKFDLATILINPITRYLTGTSFGVVVTSTGLGVGMPTVVAYPAGAAAAIYLFKNWPKEGNSGKHFSDPPQASWNCKEQVADEHRDSGNTL